jgi:hypothetical protein
VRVFLKTSSTVEELYQRSLLLTKISYTHATYTTAIPLLNLIYQNFFDAFIKISSCFSFLIF